MTYFDLEDKFPTLMHGQITMVGLKYRPEVALAFRNSPGHGLDTKIMTGLAFAPEPDNPVNDKAIAVYWDKQKLCYIGDESIALLRVAQQEMLTLKELCPKAKIKLKMDEFQNAKVDIDGAEVVIPNVITFSFVVELPK